MGSKARPQLRTWIISLLQEKREESSRLEFKRELALSAPHQKAEFLRDVISLANSEGECPREPGFLVIGIKEGHLFDTTALNLDSADVGQLIDSYVFPKLKFQHFRVPMPEGERVDLFKIMPSTEHIYFVQKEFGGDKGLLRSGQSWGRRAARKLQLSVQDVDERIRQIALHTAEQKCAPLRAEVDLLRKSGPANEVRKLMYEMESLERRKDWEKLCSAASSVYPYLRDCRGVVADVVLDSLGNMMNIRDGMSTDAASSLIELAAECLPPRSAKRRSGKRISKDEEKLSIRVASLVWEAAYDAIKYEENETILESACLHLCTLGRIARYNKNRALMNAVEEHFASLADLLPAGASSFREIWDYFLRESRLELPDLPPALNRIR